MSDQDRIETTRETTPSPAADRRSPARWLLLALGLVALTVLAAQAVRGNADEPQAPAEPTAAAPAENAEEAAEEAKEAGEVAAADAATSGATIKSLNELNQKAMQMDGLFVFLAGDDEAKAKEAVAAIDKAATTIRELKVNLGLFTLAPGTPEYENIARQLPPPSAIAMVKGRGMNPVVGGIDENKLLQAFVAASSAGAGCGPSGCTIPH